jgi:Zn-dependent protease
MLTLLFWLFAFVVAITVHEASHAWMANRLGDPTPKLMGRLSLNPLVHYDPIGTTLLLVLVVLRAFGAPVLPFGWAKSVGFDPYNLKNPRKDTALISLAGPMANLILATILSLILRLGILSPFSSVSFLVNILLPVIILNVSLAIFNLLPIHPLDGEKILVGILPKKDALEFDRFMNRFGTLILFFFIFPSFNGNSPLTLVISPIFNFILNILLPSSNIV